jgi:hypothetical protein
MNTAGQRLFPREATDPPPPVRTASVRSATDAPGGRLLHLDPARHGRKLDRMHFAFDHGLAGHPLFDIEKLLYLARTTAETRLHDIYYDAVHVEAGSRWSEIPVCDFSVTDALRRIQHCDSLNINFLPPDSERGDIYRVNYYLRQLGATPTPPFRSPLRDAVKRPIGGFSHIARNAYRQMQTNLRRSG